MGMLTTYRVRCQTPTGGRWTIVLMARDAKHARQLAERQHSVRAAKATIIGVRTQRA